MTSQSVGGKEERAVAPVSLHGQASRGMEPHRTGMLRVRAKQGNGVLRHLNIRLGLDLSGDFQRAGGIQQGKCQQQAGNILAGYAAVNAVVSGFQLSGAANGVGSGTGQNAAHPFHFLPHGRQGPLREPSLHVKSSVHTQRTGNRQQKPQGRAAVVAVQLRLIGSMPHGSDGVACLRFFNLRTQRVQASGGSIHIPVGFRAVKNGWRIRKGSADQQPVGLRLGRNDGDVSPQASGLNGNIHNYSPA